MKSITFTIFSEQQQIPLVRACVAGLCTEVGFDEKGCFETELCAREALTKIVDQAVIDGRCGEVFVTWTLGEGRLTMEIRDRGTPITLKPNGNSGSANGRDELLLFSLMDKVSYESENGINRLRMSRQVEQP